MKSRKIKIGKIYYNEIPKFLLISLLMLLILVCHNVVRLIKDAIVTEQLGAESISFIKFWLEIPFSSLLVLIYYSLYDKFSSESLFRIIVSFFVIFYFLFAFVFYPYTDYFHLSDHNINKLTLKFPNFKWFIIIIGNWSTTLFYLMGEVWAAVVYSTLFWQLTNRIISLKESKRFYPYLNFFSQFNLVIVSLFVNTIVNSSKKISTDIYDLYTVQIIIILVVFLGISIIILHYILEHYVINNINKINVLQTNLKKKNIIETFQMILANNTLINISLSIISYHICVNLIEGIWFYKIIQYYKTTNNFIEYQSVVFLYTGLFGMFCAFLSSYIIINFKWLYSGLVAPLITLVSGSLFFILLLCDKYEIYSNNISLIMSVALIQNVLIKGSKYGIYDSVKEMQYIPLSDELKSKGKAAIDIFSTNLGKSLGSFIQFLLLMMFPLKSLDDIVVVLFLFFILFSLLWIFVTFNLEKEIKKYY